MARSPRKGSAPHIEVEETDICVSTILAHQEPDHEIFNLGERGDYYRTVGLLALFKRGHRTLRVTDLVAGYARRVDQRWFPDEFNAKRAGDLVRWGTDLGHLARLGSGQETTWTIVDRRPKFALIGSIVRRRCIRIRDLPEAEQWKANRLLDLDYRRAAREEAKVLDVFRKEAGELLEEILVRDDETMVPYALRKYWIGGAPQRLAEVGEYLVNRIAMMGPEERAKLMRHLNALSHKLRTQQPPPIDEGDLRALLELCSPPMT